MRTRETGTPDPREPDDAELIARIRSQDRSAFETLFQRYYARVFSFVDRRLGDPSLAEETVVDVFFEVWRNAASFRAESRPSTWLFGIAHFKSLAASRSRRRASRVVAMDDAWLSRTPSEGRPEEELSARQAIARLDELLLTLGSEQREAVQLVWIEGLSHKEAAERLGVSTNAVKLRVMRARERVLREWPAEYRGGVA